MRLIRATALVLAVCFAAACSDSSADSSLRFSVLPDWNKGKLAESAAVLAELLGERLGETVRYVPCNDYPACVNALAANKIDFVWLGGKTTVDAIDVGEGHVHVFATRDIDLKFKSYFIGNADAVAAGKLAPVEDLAEWNGKAKALRFAFGSKSSTSGHLMPRYFLGQANPQETPEQAFASVGFQGSHAGTLEAVASGAVDLGALNYAWYDQAPEEKRKAAPILYTTPEYVDYAWVAHDRIGAERLAKLREIMLGLDPEKPAERSILDAWAAGSFVAAQDAQWDAIRNVRDALDKDFLRK
ncbi:MAG: phosphate/phosphite/phosphonate ABC transporter substrate-binding protein [Planctomycetota bacterium]